MKKYTKIAVASLLASTLAACSSGDSNPTDTGTTAGPAADDPTTTVGTTDAATSAGDSGTTDATGTTDGTNTDTTTGTTDGTGTDTTSGDTDGTGTDTTSGDADGTGTGTSGETDGTGTDTTSGDTDGTGTGTSGDTDGTGTDTTSGDTDGTGTDTTGGDTDGDTTSGETDGTGTDTTGGDTDGDTSSGDTGGTDGDSDGMDESFGITPSGVSPLGNPPTLADPFADPIPSPDSTDPFGSRLENDTEVATAGGPPTTPKNLRVDLVSNDWAELNWAPANDDVAVVEYRLYRSDGHIYTIRGDQTDTAGGTQAELDKYWNTTTFIDCNYTRFLERLHACAVNGPSPGDTYSYQISAVDGDGQESPRSNTVSVNYPIESNAPVPRYDDFYKRTEDTFAQDHDLSDRDYFIDKFELVFEDNFDGTAIDSTKWNTGLTWGDTRIINGEQQYFVNTQEQPGFGYDPFKVENGSLTIEAVRTPDEFVDSLPDVCFEEDPFGKDRCQFLSGALSSHDKFGMTYGYVESRMKVSGTAGALSSFYLYHRYPGQEERAHAPEIDIVEYLGENPFGDEDAFQTYHFDDVTYGTVQSAPTMLHKNPSGEKYSEAFHTFSVLWEPQLVIWYIDGKEIRRLSGPQVARQEMNIVTYLVAGSAWAPTPADDDSIFPLQYTIDYIRAYQRPEYNGNGVYPDR